jgi:hypothetical protein
MKTASLVKRVIGLSFALLVVLASLPIPATTSMNEKTRSELAACRTGNDEPIFKKSYALVIGESTYKNWPELPGAKQDVTELEYVLRKHGFEVTVLMNPTRQKFDDAIRDLKSKMDKSNPSRFLFYFTGHGYTGTSNGKELGYIVPSDAPSPRTDEEGLKAMAISMDEMQTLARIISPSHVLFVFDSCFSGTLFTTMKGIPEPILGRLNLPVRLFITAGTDKQPVPDDSVFRKAFVTGIEGAANRNKDRYVTGTELGEFLFDYVTTHSKGTQTPRYGKIRDPELSQGDFIFELPGQQSEPFKPFPLESQYYPSGWMGDGEDGKLAIRSEAATIEQKSTVVTRIEYKHGNKGWAGIYWQHPENNWGDKIGLSLAGAKRISFYARGERGGEIVEFVAGSKDPRNEGKPYPDRFKETTGKVPLSKNWTKYEIDLSKFSNQQLSSVVGAFAWVGSGGFDKEGRLVTYIADLKVE